jgi:hypothetical protein
MTNYDPVYVYLYFNLRWMLSLLLGHFLSLAFVELTPWLDIGPCRTELYCKFNKGKGQYYWTS